MQKVAQRNLGPGPGTGLGRRLAALFNVQPAEERLVLLLLLHSFCLGIPLTFTEAAANTLLLVSFGAQALPLVYVGFAVLSTAVGLCYTRLERRLSFSQLLGATLATMALSLLTLRVGLELPGRAWVVALLAVWAEVLWVLAGLEFGALLGRLFTLRQGKRLFGLVGSGEVFAGILGGLLVPVVVTLVGIANMLLLAAVSLGGALALLAVILRQLPVVEGEEAEGEQEGTGGDLKQLFRSRYLRACIGFAVLALGCYFVLDTIFYVELEARYPDEEQLASFLGLFYAAVGALTLVIRGAITGRLLDRFGLTAALLTMPAALLVTVALMLGSGFGLDGLGLFWLVILAKLLFEVLRDALDSPASLILYQPLAPALRIRVQALIESVFEPLAAGVAGLVLLLLLGPGGQGTLGLSLLLAALLLVWVVVGRKLGGLYREALAQALDTRRLGGASFSLQDQSTRALVVRSLHSTHPAEAIYALDLLEQAEDHELGARLCGLLAHPAPKVRAQAFARLERLRPPEALAAVRARLAVEPDHEVLEAGLRALAVLGEEEVFEELAERLDAVVHGVRRGAMVGLLRGGGIAGVLAAGERLITMGRSPLASERILAAEILGAVGIRNFYQPLLPLLADADPTVRRAALQAAGEVGHQRLMPPLVTALGHQELRTAAAAALVRAGASAEPAIGAGLAGAKLPRAARTRLTRVCGRIGGPAMVALLLPHLETSDSEWRSEVVAALSGCRYRADGIAFRQIHTLLLREASFGAWLLAVAQDVTGCPGAELLERACAYALERTRTRVLLLLELCYDAGLMAQVRAALEYGGVEQRAYAAESLDGLLPPSLKGPLLPLLEDLAPAERFQRLAALYPQPSRGATNRIAALVAGDEGAEELWLRACACFAAGRQGQPGYAEPLAVAATTDDPLLRETALRALRLLFLPHTTAKEAPMFSTLEKVMILKTVAIFATTADAVLLEIAGILKQVEARAGQPIFAKGDLGTSMYIIVSGRVRVYDGERTLNELGARDVFGEMALLDPEPRMASVTAIEPSVLFHIDHGPFYELMSDRVEVAYGIIRVLAGHLRARVRDVAALHQQVRELQIQAAQVSPGLAAD